MRQMHSSFPLVACASEECENWRYVLQYKDERGVGGGGAVKAVCVITPLMEGCDRPETSLPHYCAFLPVAKYLSVVITLWLYCVGLEMGVHI